MFATLFIYSCSMKWMSLTWILSCIFIAYMANSIWTIYCLFYPTPCQPNTQCLKSFLETNPKLQIWVYTSLRNRVSAESQLQLVTTFDNLAITDEIERKVNISIPKKTQNNGTLFLHIFLVPQGVLSPFSSPWKQHQHSSLTTYIIPQAETFNLMGSENKLNNTQKQHPDSTVSHWRSHITLSIMEDEMSFGLSSIPNEIHQFISIYKNAYLPVLYVDELSYRIRDLLPINNTVTKLPLTITYRPISVGKLRLWINMQLSMSQLQALGFTEKDTDEIKGIFADTNLYLLLLTFMVAAFHMLFDVLAFKNDISYWRNRKTMVGLSTRTVVWRCISTFIIFLYLLDEETSMLVLIPSGLGAIIELGSASEKERQTKEFDLQAMKYLSYLLYPLCLCGAVYSLIYTPHKSWYSWTIKSMVNGVYAFGFLFMLPQLFVNYKVSHHDNDR
ncbi:hypothetical protein LSH36_735g01064 [Paralvinella palmiformis]|uniref:Lipid scramblase CLPTM1L n=1 Tax=Paralvinella palmiformis TaxID=53620 RepID=A0AAD9J1S9_9ANNE|nr:hypothetical protein LSH36_735g01064 [Paralvinella palmiformis]